MAKLIIFARLYPLSDSLMEMISFVRNKNDKIIFYIAEEKGQYKIQKKMVSLLAENISLDKECYEIHKVNKHTKDELTSLLKKKNTLLYLESESVKDFLLLNLKLSKADRKKIFYRDASFYTEEEKALLTSFKKLNLERQNYSCADIIAGSLLYSPYNVLKYIAKNKLFYCHSLASKMKEKRYIHSCSVAKTAYLIAKKNKIDIPLNICYQAGLFHDSAKDLSIEEQKELASKLYQDEPPIPSFALHEFASAYLAKEEYHITDDKVLSAISCHCLGKGDMSDLDKIIYTADKIEPTRVFKTKDLRKIAYKDFNKGFLATLLFQQNYFIENHIPYLVHPLSKKMYEQYVDDDKRR